MSAIGEMASRVGGGANDRRSVDHTVTDDLETIFCVYKLCILSFL